LYPQTLQAAPNQSQPLDRSYYPLPRADDRRGWGNYIYGKRKETRRDGREKEEDASLIRAKHEALQELGSDMDLDDGVTPEIVTVPDGDVDEGELMDDGTAGQEFDAASSAYFHHASDDEDEDYLSRTDREARLPTIELLKALDHVCI
jgi:hypothetical protein